MNYYYLRYVHGTLYESYLIHIRYSDDTGHVALILPVQGGNIVVMDPAGHYLTSEYGVITSKNTSAEPTAYESYLSSTQGTVKNVKLYRINTNDGSYEVLVDGTFTDLDNFM